MPLQDLKASIFYKLDHCCNLFLLPPKFTSSEYKVPTLVNTPVTKFIVFL